LWPSSANTPEAWTSPRAILHADCDAFFASVEQALDPSLRGKPVVTGKERGIAASMSYEAKRRGVTRAMRLFEVRRVCPEAIILPNDYETYSLFSKRFHAILRRFTPSAEEYSIDEAYADLTGVDVPSHASVEAIAARIKETFRVELGLPVSVGLSHSKTLAKLCSKARKPDGFVCVRGRPAAEEFLADIPVSAVCGFGPNSTALLAKQGVRTALDYVRRPMAFARKLLGKIGEELWRELRGEAVYPILGEPEPQQSLGKAKTFTPPSDDKAFVRAQLLRNLESAFIKLRRHRLKAAFLYVHLRNRDFESRGAGTRLLRPTASTLEAAGVAAGLFEKVYRKGVLYRQTGVYLADLAPEGEIQYDLFEDAPKARALKRLSETADRINERYGKHAVHLASTHCLEHYRQHLGDRGDLAARKTRLLKGETFRQRLNVPIWNLPLKAGF
jgi:DNA polymerase IV